MSLNAQRYGRRPSPAESDYDDDLPSTLIARIAPEGPCVLGIFARLSGRALSDSPRPIDACLAIGLGVAGLDDADRVARLNDMGRFKDAWRVLGAALFEREDRGHRWPPLEPGEPPLGLGDRIAGLLAGVRAVEALKGSLVSDRWSFARACS